MIAEDLGPGDFVRVQTRVAKFSDTGATSGRARLSVVMENGTNTGEHPRSLFTANPRAEVAFQLTEEQNKSSGVSKMGESQYRSSECA